MLVQRCVAVRCIAAVFAAGFAADRCQAAVIDQNVGAVCSGQLLSSGLCSGLCSGPLQCSGVRSNSAAVCSGPLLCSGLCSGLYSGPLQCSGPLHLGQGTSVYSYNVSEAYSCRYIEKTCYLMAAIFNSIVTRRKSLTNG